MTFDEINDATGFAEGDKWDSPAEVFKYFTAPPHLMEFVKRERTLCRTNRVGAGRQTSHREACDEGPWS